MEHVTPEMDRLALVSEADDGKPVVMLNLNRYREKAAYEDGREVSGRDAYLAYAAVAIPAIASVGGKVLWVAEGREVAIGCEHDAYDEVVAVWYPSRAAFLNLPSYPGYMEAHEHRDAGVEQAVLLACSAEAEPLLRGA